MFHVFLVALLSSALASGIPSAGAEGLVCPLVASRHGVISSVPSASARAPPPLSTQERDERQYEVGLALDAPPAPPPPPPQTGA